MTSNSTTDSSITVTQEQIDEVLNGRAKKANDYLYLWNQVNGQNASTTGTIYGIYDFNGGLYEFTASFISNENENLDRFGQAVVDATVNANTKTSSKYATIYSPYSDIANSGSDTEENGRSQSNFKTFIENSNMYGDAVKETTSTNAGTNNSDWNVSSWNNDNSNFPEGGVPFFRRGGEWSGGSTSGIFSYNRSSAGPSYASGFRPVLVSSTSP